MFKHSCLYFKKRSCVSLFVFVYHHLCCFSLHSKMLTDWTVSKSDAGLNDGKLLFFACSNTITSRFHYFSMVFVHVRACVCVHPVLNLMKGIFCSSQSQVIFPHKRVKHTHANTHSNRPDAAHTHTQVTTYTHTRGYHLHVSIGSAQLTTCAFTLDTFACAHTHAQHALHKCAHALCPDFL